MAGFSQSPSVDGRHACFEALAAKHKDAVYRQMIRVCGNHEDAEDVLIEALLNAYLGLDRLSDEGRFRAWLAQIARRVCWHLKDYEALHPVIQLSSLQQNGFEPAARDRSPERALSSRDTKRAIERAVSALPAQYAEIYQLRDVLGLSGEETAERLGLSLAAQKSRLYRARMLLRSHLDRAFLDS